MSESVLNLLKICLLILLYLFFLRVLRAVFAELSPRAATAPVPTGKPRSGRNPGRAAAKPRKRKPGGPGTSLVVVDPPEQKGRQFELDDEITVGRAAGCQITLDDTYVSQLHARIFRRDGQIFVEDLGSTNGTYLNRKKLTSPTVYKKGDQLQVGNVVLELA